MLTDDTPPARLPRPLDPVEVRTLGALLEKQQATPENYPLTLHAPAKAVMTLLLLRGEQTPGELRGRSDRLHPFATTADVEAALEKLAAGPEPLVAELPRRPGQKETRWTHLVAGPVEGAQSPAAPAARASGPAVPAAPSPRLDALASRVDALEERLAAISRELSDLKRTLGED